jgi:hypothetical protein
MDTSRARRARGWKRTLVIAAALAAVVALGIIVALSANGGSGSLY